MINVFQIASNDQSLYYLAQIFGPVGGLLPSQNAITILGTMFKVFNTMALVLGSIVVVYTTIVGLFATAAEGEFLGKKWHGIWVPLRMLMGMAALFPSSSGYSGLQALIMWCVIQGIGAADTLWSTVLKYVNLTGSPYSSFSLPSAGVNQQLQTLFQSLVCQAQTKQKVPTPDTGTQMTYMCAGSSDPFCTYSQQDMLNINGVQTVRYGNKQVVYGMGPARMCGTITYCDASDPAVCPTSSTGDPGKDLTNKLNCAGCKAQAQALQTIVTTFGSLTANIATADDAYIRFWTTPYNPVTRKPEQPDFIKQYCASKGIPLNACCYNQVPPQGSGISSLIPNATAPCPSQRYFPGIFGGNNPPPYNVTTLSNDAISSIFFPFVAQPATQGTDFITAATNYYIGAVSGAVMDIIAQLPNSNTGQYETAQRNGWIQAGAYYYKIAQVNNAQTTAALPDLVATNKDPGTGSYATIRTNFIAAATLIQEQISRNQQASSLSNISPTLSQLTASSQGLIQAFMSNLTTDKSNPLASLQAYGEAILITAQVLFSVFLVAAFWLVTFGSTTAWVLGTGLNTGLGSGFTIAFYILLPVMMGFLSALFVFGGTLAVYVPLIPFILFTMAAVGWFIGVIEAMVASPLIALGIMSPGGQHEVLGKAEPALMLLLSVVLRPSLMIFGLIIALLLSIQAVSLVNATFRYTIGTILPAPGLPEFIMILAVYTFIIVSVINKCFSLIHLIPERVITWIGGHAVTYGEEQALGEAKKGVESAAGATMGAVSGGIGLAKGVGEAKRFAKDEGGDKSGKIGIKPGNG